MDTIEKQLGKINETVSVIIPTYNRALWICEAVDSVLAQTTFPFEVIVVDDGSIDETPALLRSYGNSITVLFQANKGVSSARNAGITHSRGRYVALLDSDDLWEKDKLTNQLDFFRKNPDALICQTGEIWIRNGKRVNPMNKHKKLSGMIFEPSLHLCLVSPSAVMIKRELLDTVGLFDESLPACEDYDLWLRIACRYPIYTTEASQVIKRGGHDDQLSRAPGLDKFRIKAIEKILGSNSLTPEQSLAAIAVLTEKCRIYAEGCRKRGRNDEADHYTSLMNLFE